MRRIDEVKTYDFSRWLSDMQEKKGFTLTKLAKKTGMAVVSISRYKTGKREPDLRHALKLMKAMGINKIDVNSFYY